MHRCKRKETRRTRVYFCTWFLRLLIYFNVQKTSKNFVFNSCKILTRKRIAVSAQHLTILRIAGGIVKALALALAVLAVGLVVAWTIAQHTDPSWQNVRETCIVWTYLPTSNIFFIGNTPRGRETRFVKFHYNIFYKLRRIKMCKSESVV